MPGFSRTRAMIRSRHSAIWSYSLPRSTTCSGWPPPMFRLGGRNTKACTPGMAASGPRSMPAISGEENSRSERGSSGE